MKTCCVSFSGRPIVLSQASQVLQIQTPQAVTGSVVTMPTLRRDAAPPVVSLTLRSPSPDDDVSPVRTLCYIVEPQM